MTHCTPLPLRSTRPVEWIVELEQGIGDVLCAHPEDHYPGG
ncbi:MAG TPA: hypothetical protein VFT22_33450 [Kofleriaceae bacterium]|nr:hypothetical protein [Kofleriaceae bacterium]